MLIFLCSSFGEAIDKEFEIKDEITNHYIGG